MKDGYYWFIPAESETIPDLDHPQPLEVRGENAYLCGSEWTYKVAEFKGVFIRLAEND